MLSISKEQIKHTIDEWSDRYANDPFMSTDIRHIQEHYAHTRSQILAVGQFSAGKSALLNALLGHTYLKAHTNETTKTITRIFALPEGKTPSFKTVSIHGNIIEEGDIDFEKVEKYTTFQKEADVHEEVQYLDLYIDVPFLNEELILVDTPGANSRTIEAFETTEDILFASAAVLYLFQAPRGIDVIDDELIQRFLRQGKHVILVGTRYDTISEAQWEDVKSDVEKRLATYCADIPPIFPVASLQAMEAKQSANEKLLVQSGLADLERALSKYMETKAYESAELNSLRHAFEEVALRIEAYESMNQVASVEKEKERQLREGRLRQLIAESYEHIEAYGINMLSELTFDTDAAGEQFLLQLKNIQVQKNKEERQIRREFQKRSIKCLDQSNFKRVMTEYQTYQTGCLDLLEHWNKEVDSMFMDHVNGRRLNIEEELSRFFHAMEVFDLEHKVDWDIAQIELKRDVQLIEKLDLIQTVENRTEEMKQLKSRRTRLFNSSKRTSLKLEEMPEQLQSKIAHIDEDLKLEKESLGTKPEVEEYVSEKRKWLLFKERTVRRDSTARNDWIQKHEELKREHEKTRQQLINQSAKQLKEAEDTLAKLEEEIVLHEKKMADYEANTIEEIQELLRFSSADIRFMDEQADDIHATVVDALEDVKEATSQTLRQFKSNFKAYVDQEKAKALRDLHVIR
ncbi:dynamin family protein [Exiguobacterium sp. s149]|uniref:dynamin family protein n=1 Tax=Exiguobacterium TaxID=33986 RepID=UPI001BECBB00|nr:dynamin family protein [Exiguobacterium sp. s149]